MHNTRDGWDGIKPIIFRIGMAGNGATWTGKAISIRLPCGIKCAWKVTTVSPSYLEELRYMSNGLEALFEYEKGKCSGILNGIDTKVWDPETDTYLDDHYSIETIEEGKSASKEKLCQAFNLDIESPLIVFIGGW